MAWYGPVHLERMHEIRALQRKGLTLAAIRRVLARRARAADADLAAAVAAARGDIGTEPEKLLTLDEFSARSGVPASLIQAVEREGIKLGRPVEGEDGYTAADIELVRTALRLLEFGLPLPDLLALSSDADRRCGAWPIARSTCSTSTCASRSATPPVDDEQAATQMVEAFRELLPAVTTLVSHHFRRVLLETAEAHIEEPAAADEGPPRERTVSGGDEKVEPFAGCSTRSRHATTS